MIAAVLLMVAPGAVYAADGDLDPTFGIGGKVRGDVGHLNGLALQPDGKLVGVGVLVEAQGTEGDFAAVRYNADGSLDLSFSGDGKVRTDTGNDDTLLAVALQPDGKIVAAGTTGTNAGRDFALVRYNADGSVDTGFNTDGRVTTDFAGSRDEANAVLVQSDGNIVVAGSAFIGDDFDTALARYNADGSLDTTFGGGDGKVTTDVSGGGGFDAVFAAMLQPDGKIVVAGYGDAPSRDFALARYNSDGSLDTTFGGGDGTVTTDVSGVGGSDHAFAASLQPDGKIVAGGSVGEAATRDFALARYNADGSVDATFGGGDGTVITAMSANNDEVTETLVQSDGKVVALGWSSTPSIDFALARYNPDGSPDTTTFGGGDGKVTTDMSGSGDFANAAVLQPDGKIVAAGNAGPVFGLARYEGTTTGPPQADVSVSSTDSPDPVVAGQNITYTITMASSLATSTATNVSLSDAVPANTTFVSRTFPSGWSCTTGLSCTRASLTPADGPQAFTLVVQVNASTAGGTVITNTATVGADGDSAAAGNNVATATTTVNAPAPTVTTTQASEGGPVGSTSVTDTATVTGGSSPSGTVTFRLFSDAACTTQVFTSTNPLSGGSATSGSHTPTAAGSYYWTAVYSGDANNQTSSSPCGAPNESVVVAKATPSLSTQASGTVAAGGQVSDTATVSGGFNPSGAVSFVLYSDNTCTTSVFTSTNRPLSSGSATSAAFTATTPGTYYWVATYSGDANNNAVTAPCNAPNESVSVGKASPTLSTQASPGGPVSTSVTDTATLVGGSSPTGTVTFRLFSDAGCTTQVFTSTNYLAGGSATSDAHTPSAPGIYYWTAVYNGDTINNAATSPCGAPNESVVIGKVTPTLVTTASPATQVGGEISDSAVLADGASPTGTITFRLYGPNDTNCSGAAVFSATPTVNGNGTYGSGAYATNIAGTYRWTAIYGGDANNNAATSACNAPNESVTVTKASPTLTTQASPGNLVGAPVRDTATLAGGAAPTGDVTFRLFSDAFCATQVFTSTNNLSGLTTTSDWFIPATPGTYRWTAFYNGDANNNTATSPCNAPEESVTLTAFQAPTYTQTATGDLVGPLTVAAGQSLLINTGARVVGPVTVSPGGALTVVSATITRGVIVDDPSFLSICGSSISGSSPAQALGVSNANVPIRIGDPAAGCAGNRFAGQVNLTANLGVTFGANSVSHNTTITNGGPAATVIKANTVFGTLGCTGNTPAPTNAGQANTGGPKTGQCANL